MKNTHNKSDSELLRQKAEDLLKKKSAGTASPFSEVESIRLIHELEVHQVELEMQNEELQRARAIAEVANDKYIRLYDFAPSGYFTLSDKGEIIELNLSGAKMLGKDRQHLKNSLFGFFVSEETKPIFNRFLEKAFNGKVKESCDVTLLQDGNLPMYGHLTGIVYKNGEQCLVTMVDITERKHAENAIMESEEQLTRILNDVTDVVWSLSWPDMKVNFISPSVEQVFGRPMAEFAENPSLWSTTVHPDDQHISDIALQQLINEGSAVRECRIIRPDGSIVWINDKSKIIVDQNGKPIRLDGVSRDITERKQAEITVKESEEKYRNVFTAERDSLFLIDRATHAILDVNDAACGLYGYSREEMLKLKNSDMSFEPEETKRATIEFKDRIDLRYHKKKDGTIFPVNISASRFILKGKEVILAAIRDITSQKHAEDTLRDSEEKYRTLIENMGEGIGFLNSEETFVFANPSAEKMFGVDKGKLTGLCLNDFLPGKNIEIVNNEIQLRKQGKSSTYEIEIISKDGSKKDIMVTATPSFRDEKFIGTFGIFRDITDRKQSEEKIKHKNEQLIQANAEKDKFFSIISHDLRGPFNGFLGLSKILAEDLQNLTQEEIKKMSGGMRNSAINLFQLLENLLEWSRLQRGITSYEAEPFLLMPMIAESMQPVMDLADKKEIEISYEIPAGLEVFADKYMLASTIRNLASNAVKFTTKGGKVTIAAKTIPGHSVEFSVKDTGIGMNPELVDDLFRLDIQTNRRGTENEPSTGLGLLLCKDFVEKHGGKLWVESEEGKGSTFYFNIPYKAEVQTKDVKTNSVPSEDIKVKITHLKILIAEDDEISDSLFSAMVDKYSHEVLHVKTGVDAIHACRNNPDVDLVLMDINLVGMDGCEATRQIRQFNNDVVIIAQTAFGYKFDKETAIVSGCNDYIQKPIDQDELRRLIHKYFTV